MLWHLSDGWWDTAFPRFVLNGAAECDHHVGLELAWNQNQGTWNMLPHQSVGVICIPGRHSVDHLQAINFAAESFEKCVFIIYGDEEGLFPGEKLEHPNKVLWWFMPPFARAHKADRVAINGWPTDAPVMIAAEKQKSQGVRDYDWSFAGQNTHSRREACFEASKNIPRGVFQASSGFTQGLPREAYYNLMVRSKLVLCPGGPRTTDTFRIAEALEAGCIPIADDFANDPRFPGGYWQYIFSTHDLPFPVVSSWDELPQIMNEWLPDKFDMRCPNFWSAYKEQLIAQMREDLNA